MLHSTIEKKEMEKGYHVAIWQAEHMTQACLSSMTRVRGCESMASMTYCMNKGQSVYCAPLTCNSMNKPAGTYLIVFTANRHRHLQGYREMLLSHGYSYSRDIDKSIELFSIFVYRV